MSNAIIEFLQSYKLSPEIIIFIISLLPILELRGGLIAASLMGVPLVNAFVICFIANILPIPFILLFIKRIFKFLKRFKTFEGLVASLESKAIKRSDSIKKKQLLGLFAFVAVPLPGTGGWTGSLIAALLGMDIKKSFLTVMAGVFTAGVIMVVITYFIPGLFGFNGF